MATTPKDIVPLDFEKPLVEMQRRMDELSILLSDSPDEDLYKQMESMRERINAVTEELYGELTNWQITQVARHPQRPFSLDYIGRIFDDFTELHGDRLYKDDGAIVGGFAKFNGKSVMVIGQQRSRTMEEGIKRNFGMPNPEGYRKAMRLMRMAEKFNKPVIALIDTPGAYPGLGAEERGQAEAIAKNLYEMAVLKVPIICAVIGEGGSGGALGIGVGNRVLMLKYSIYSVISPESCASIVWRDSEQKILAAASLKNDSKKALELGLIDEIIDEPIGGAHRNHEKAAENLAKALQKHLDEVSKMNSEELVKTRIEKFAKMGVIKE